MAGLQGTAQPSTHHAGTISAAASAAAVEHMGGISPGNPPAPPQTTLTAHEAGRQHAGTAEQLMHAGPPGMSPNTEDGVSRALFDGAEPVAPARTRAPKVAPMPNAHAGGQRPAPAAPQQTPTASWDQGLQKHADSVAKHQQELPAMRAAAKLADSAAQLAKVKSALEHAASIDVYQAVQCSSSGFGIAFKAYPSLISPRAREHIQN